MFPSELLSVCTIVGGASITAFIALLYYFKDRVDDYTVEHIAAFFSSKENLRLIKEISQGKVSSKVSEALVSDLSETQEPKVRLRRIVVTLPVAGCLFIISAIVGSLVHSENEFISQIATEVEIFAYGALLIAVIFLVYSIIQLIRMNRRLV